ncbi:type IV pilus modification protein PilV [Vandammella animalimorsus]|uniref:Type IV pilus modification protein PilV n=1 Tax=Vandammella animalimorsus TaxID=2029117 RepID=A0A2A2AX36_9BURK|nr:type IV pilus modification protein PilV [Vandammella animalimorsus]PAT42317.1 type IV pilus modification protein PilV [Vandammella animalimorsus]
MKRTSNPTLVSSQGGVSLIEALIAVLVTALGILGILGMQMRTMAETQTAVRQAQAIRLVENLSERMRMNPNSFTQSTASNYLIGWGAPGTPGNCSGGCDSSNQALADIEQWKRDVAAALPLGDANVFFVNDEASAGAGSFRQVGVMISWRANESAANANDANFNQYFRLTSTNQAGQSVACPQGRTCYLQFIQLSARCTADMSSGTPRPYCGDGSAKRI